jgi:hypothetical protein
VAGILGPVLLPLGFTRRGARFMQEDNGLVYSIYLERSSWNTLTDRPKQLAVIVEAGSDKAKYGSVSLFRLTKLKFPTYYSPFFLDDLDWPGKSALMASFSASQLEEIDNYLDSIDWYYDSEASLVALLHEIAIQVKQVGLPTIGFVKELVVNGLESYNLSLEMKRKANQLYLLQLDPGSAFPNE